MPIYHRQALRCFVPLSASGFSRTDMQSSGLAQNTGSRLIYKGIFDVRMDERTMPAELRVQFAA